MFESAQLFVKATPGRAFTSLVLTLFTPPPVYSVTQDLGNMFRVPSAPSDSGSGRFARTRQWIYTGVCAVIFAIVLLLCLALVLARGGSPWIGALISPPGALLRYSLSLALNRDSFPHGTLLANVLACFLDATLQALIYRKAGNPNTQLWFGELFSGLGGALGTVSAFAAELITLSSRSRLIYGFISIFVAQVIFLVIYGTAVWTS